MEKFIRFNFDLASQTCVQKVSSYFVWGEDLLYLADCSQHCFVFAVMGPSDIPKHHIVIDSYSNQYPTCSDSCFHVDPYPDHYFHNNYLAVDAYSAASHYFDQSIIITAGWEVFCRSCLGCSSEICCMTHYSCLEGYSIVFVGCTQLCPKLLIVDSEYYYKDFGFIIQIVKLAL